MYNEPGPMIRRMLNRAADRARDAGMSERDDARADSARLQRVVADEYTEEEVKTK